jgi:hypothetical protein
VGELFGRRARVSVGSFAVGAEVGAPSIGGAVIKPQLRIAFKVERDRKPEPNKNECQIYNLSEESRAAIKRGQLLTIDAGYPDSFGQIFQGDVRTFSHVQVGADWITKIAAGDGEVAHRTARVSESFGPKTKVSAVLQKLCDAYGVKIGNASDMVKTKAKINEYLRGKAIHGLVSEQLEKMLRENGLEYSIQDGALQVVEIGKAVNAPAVKLDPSCGLIGSPEIGEQGKDKKTVIKMKSLMQPRIIPGRLIDLESKTHTGLVRADKVSHLGDTGKGSTPFYTEVEGSLL